MKENKSNLKFDEIYQIMTESFPEQELRSYQGQKDLLDHPWYHIYTRREQEKLLGFLTYWSLPSCVFIEHLATTERSRGKGIGRELMLECLAGTELPVFLEIEPIVEKNIITNRRAEFYKRLGFYVNEFPYQQQPLQYLHRPLDLWVMSYGKTYSEDEFMPYKKEIYAEVYKTKIK